MLRQKKVSKEKATPLPATLRAAKGDLLRRPPSGVRANSLRSDKRGPLSAWRTPKQAREEGSERRFERLGETQPWLVLGCEEGVGWFAPRANAWAVRPRLGVMRGLAAAQAAQKSAASLALRSANEVELVQEFFWVWQACRDIFLVDGLIPQNLGREPNDCTQIAQSSFLSAPKKVRPPFGAPGLRRSERIGQPWRISACAASRMFLTMGNCKPCQPVFSSTSALALAPAPAISLTATNNAAQRATSQTANRRLSPSCLCREAQRQAEQGRACLSEASLHGPRLARASQAARSEAEGQGQWGRLSFAYFSLARQRKVGRPPGRTPGQPRSQAPHRHHQATSFNNRRNTFPDPVAGNASMKATTRGAL